MNPIIADFIEQNGAKAYRIARLGQLMKEYPTQMSSNDMETNEPVSPTDILNRRFYAFGESGLIRDKFERRADMGVELLILNEVMNYITQSRFANHFGNAYNQLMHRYDIKSRRSTFSPQDVRVRYYCALDAMYATVQQTDPQPFKEANLQERIKPLDQPFQVPVDFRYLMPAMHTETRFEGYEEALSLAEDLMDAKLIYVSAMMVDEVKDVDDKVFAKKIVNSPKVSFEDGIEAILGLMNVGFYYDAEKIY